MICEEKYRREPRTIKMKRLKLTPTLRSPQQQHACESQAPGI